MMDTRLGVDVRDLDLIIEALEEHRENHPPNYEPYTTTRIDALLIRARDARGRALARHKQH